MSQPYQAMIMGKPEFKSLIVKLRSIEDGQALTGSHLGNLQEAIKFLSGRLESIRGQESLDKMMRAPRRKGLKNA